MSQHRPELSAASTLDGSYPRPQLVRSDWASLDGVWSFGYDDEDQGLAQALVSRETRAPDAAFDRDIVVPFPPESAASGVNDPSFHPVVWYRRVIVERTCPSPLAVGAGPGCTSVPSTIGRPSGATAARWASTWGVRHRSPSTSPSRGQPTATNT